MKRLFLFFFLISNFCLSQTTATINWVAPTNRVNGEVLPISQIAGYEIRYLKKGALQSSELSMNVVGSTFCDISIQSPETYDWKIAAYDLQNRYSDYVVIAQSISSTSSSSSASSSGKILPAPINFKVVRF